MNFEENAGTQSELAQSNFKLVPKITISENTSEVFTIRFSPDGKFVAAGCGDGAIRVFNAHTGALAYNLQGGSSVALPTTALRFRPVTATTRTKNVFVAANAAGAAPSQLGVARKAPFGDGRSVQADYLHTLKR